MPRVWEDALTEHDRRCLAARPPRAVPELGSRPALLVIDMQKGVIGEDRPIYEQMDRYPLACGPFAWESIRHLEKLIPAARAAEVPVVYSQHLFTPEMRLPQSNPSSAFSSLNPLSAIQDEIAPQPGDLVITKQRASVFFHTGLVYMLQNMGVDTLLITGNTTSGCVRATAIDGGGYNFKVAVIEECIFDRIELSHKASLFDLWFKYCRVLALDEAHRYIERVAQKEAVGV
jgi:maleamate amidohydrolase